MTFDKAALGKIFDQNSELPHLNMCNSVTENAFYLKNRLVEFPLMLILLIRAASIANLSIPSVNVYMLTRPFQQPEYNGEKVDFI